jgi:hypothetical protein
VTAAQKSLQDAGGLIPGSWNAAEQISINELKRRWRHRTVSAPGALQVALRKIRSQAPAGQSRPRDLIETEITLSRAPAAARNRNLLDRGVEAPSGVDLALISGGIDTFLKEKIPNAAELFDYICINPFRTITERA